MTEGLAVGVRDGFWRDVAVDVAVACGEPVGVTVDPAECVTEGVADGELVGVRGVAVGVPAVAVGVRGVAVGVPAAAVGVWTADALGDAVGVDLVGGVRLGVALEPGDASRVAVALAVALALVTGLGETGVGVGGVLVGVEVADVLSAAATTSAAEIRPSPF